MADGQGGNTGSSGGNGGNTRDSHAEADAMLRRFRGSAVRSVAYVLDQLHSAIDRANKAEGDLTELKKKVPADGAVVINADEAKEWDLFKKLGKKASDVTESLKQYDTLRAESEKRKFDEEVAQAAEDLEWNPQLLPTLLRDKGLTVESRDVVITDDDGKRRKVPLLHVRPASDDKAQWEPVDEYVERELKGYLPALQALPDDLGDDEDSDAESLGGEGAEDMGDENDTRQTGRPNAYAAARGARQARNGARNGTRSASRNTDGGVEFPPQRAPRPRSARVDLDKLIEEKASRGEYHSF
jgi:hypothetical protein